MWIKYIFNIELQGMVVKGSFDSPPIQLFDSELEVFMSAVCGAF